MTAIGTIAASLIAVFALRNNNKMLEESTRPRISIFLTTIDYISPIQVIVIKNDGASAAVINKIYYHKKNTIKMMNVNDDRAPFDDIKGYILAPGQYVLLYLDSNSVVNNRDKVFNLPFEILYSSTLKKKYKETVNIMLNSTFNIPSVKANIDYYNKESKCFHEALSESFEVNESEKTNAEKNDSFKLVIASAIQEVANNSRLK